MKSRSLIVILVLAGAVRVAVLVAATHAAPDALHTPDSDDYLALADSIGRGEFQRDGQPEIFRTPGYPLLLAALNDRSTVAAVVQVALDVVLVYVTYLLAGELCGGRGARVAAGLAALCPLAISSSVRVLSDGLFTLMLAGALLLVVRHLRRGGGWLLVGGAVVAVLACYVRPAGLLAVGAMGGVLGFTRDRLRRCLLVVGVSAACLGPWVVRNAIVADYVGFSSFAGDSLYYHAAPAMQADRTGLSPREARRMAAIADEVARAENPSESVGQAAARRASSAVGQITDHPWRYVRLHVSGAMSVLLPGATDVLELLGASRGQRGTLDVLRTQGLAAAVEHYFGESHWSAGAAAMMSLLPMAVYLGTGVWMVSRLRLRMGAAKWLGVVVVVVLILAPGPVGVPRFRTPVMPLLHVAAAAGWVIVCDLLARLRQRHAPTPAD